MADNQNLINQILGAQEHGAVLDDLNTLGRVTANGQFLVGTGSGVFAYVSGAAVRAVLGLTIGTNVQAHGNILDDLNSLGQVEADGQFLVGTEAGKFAWESGNTVRTSLGLTIGTNVQAHGNILDDLNSLGAATADGQFIVAVGAGAFAYESGNTVRTSLGLGVENNPQFSGISLLADGANLVLRNTVDENGNDQAETEIFFQDHSSTSLGKIRVAHTGTADDTKGLMGFYTHTGSALILGLKITEIQEVGIPGKLALYGGATNSLICHISGATTGACRFRMQNSGNFLDWGVESSAGGVLFPFTSAYSAVFGSTSAVSLHLCTNNAKRLTIDENGQTTVEAGSLICGLDSNNRGSIALWDGSGGNQPGYILVHSPNGTGWYVFVEDDGTVKVHNSIPTQNGDGSAIGDQTD